MLMTLDAATATIRKVATTDAEAERLDQEAAVLAVARHPGVVQLRAFEPRTLELRAVSGWCLSDIGGLRPAEVAGIGCAIANVLADLHDIGVVHGALEASHVLIGSDGRPVLCSLGRGRLPGSDTGADPDSAADVAALVAILRSWLPSSPVADDGSEDLRRALRSRRRLGVKRHPTARQLAARLAAVPGATLPDPGQCSSAPTLDASAAAGCESAPASAGPASPRFGRRGLDRTAWVGAIGVVVAVAMVVVGSSVGFGHRPSLRVAKPPGCPRVDAGCGPVDHRDGVVVTESGRFAVGDTSDDPVVLGRWTCGPVLPALLRLSQGEVWVWDRWPTGDSVLYARLAGRVEGAKTLRVVAGSSGCDHLAVIGTGGATTTLAVNMS